MKATLRNHSEQFKRPILPVGPLVVHLVWLVLIKVKMNINIIEQFQIITYFNILAIANFEQFNQIDFKFTLDPAFTDPTVMKLCVKLKIILFPRALITVSEVGETALCEATFINGPLFDVYV